MAAKSVSLPVNASRRRKAVAAESYDPEQEDEEANAVFVKSEQQRQQLTDEVRKIFLFRTLDKEQMRIIIDAMFEKKVKAGEVVIKQGDDGDNFYIIQEGTFHAYAAQENQEPALIKKYKNGGSFGELALLYNQPRAATVTAVTDGILWAIDRATFRKIILQNAFKKRKLYEVLLNSVLMLKELSSYERTNLADALIPMSFPPGERIIKQGDGADGMYFIESGIVRITVLDKAGNEVEIKRLGKGGYFGELALITHRPRAASAYAVNELGTAFLDVEAFERLLGPCMHIMKRNIDTYKEQISRYLESEERT